MVVVAHEPAAGPRLRVDVLGPLRVRDPDGRDVTPEGSLQRRLLALLVLRRGHLVSIEAAIEVLWPTRPPQDRVGALHNHVFRLRRRLGVEVVESTGQGYRLRPSLIDLDLDRLVAALGAPDPMDGAGEAMAEVLARWHGPAYPELDDVDEGRAEAVRCAELRVRAREALAERRLASGDTDGLVAELSALATDEPLRERPRSMLMTALVAAGRHVEALRVYDDFRRLLGDELGIEPSPALVAQHDAVLRGTSMTAWTPATRLPVAVTSLVGRDALVDDVVTTVSEQRLVTLIGPGGVGKTRVLVEAGRRLLAVRGDRPVVMASLATADETSAVDVVAAALGIEGRPGVGLAERVAAVLADVDVVLLLDNCEHVLEAIADLVDRILSTCPLVSIAATSRERLRVAAECVVPVPTLLDDAAVDLFVERACAVAPGFEPAPVERAVVAEIVRRLDGLPLGIELAAARLHTLDVHEVAVGLDDRFRLLSGGYRTSTRHSSLGAAVSWSYGLLDPPLQRAFVDLSAFTGPFTLSAAAAVCDVDLHAAAAALDRLVERSLVMRAPNRRYVLLETLRAFGADRLTASADARRRHACHHVEWVEAADRALVDPGAPGTLTEIEGALPELRGALDWLLDHGEVGEAARLVGALLDYGFFRLRPDVLAWARRVLDAGLDIADPSMPRIWVATGYAAWMAGDMAEVGALAARLLDMTAGAGRDVPSRVAVFVGSHDLFSGRLVDAARWFRHGGATAGDRAGRLLGFSSEVLALGYAGARTADARAARLLDEVDGDATPLAAYAWYAAGEADAATGTADGIARAAARHRRAVELAEACGASLIADVAGASLTSIEARHGDPSVAADDYRRLISQWRRAGMWSTQWTMLRSIAALLATLERPVDAAVLLGAVRATTRRAPHLRRRRGRPGRARHAVAHRPR